MAFTNLPIWKNEGAEPPTELKNSGFTAGYKPPASYFNWFWNKVSTCIKEVQDFLNKSSSTITKDITVPATGWLVDSTGFYKLTILDADIEEINVVTLNLSLESFAIAEDCGLRGVTESIDGGFNIFAEKIPTSFMVGTLVVQKGVK